MNLPKLITVSAALLLCSCYTTKLYYAGEGDGSLRERAVPGRTHYVTSAVWAWGLVTPTRVNLDGYCSVTSIRNVRTQVSAVGAVLAVLTLGIYSQTSTMIVCTPKVRERGDGLLKSGKDRGEATPTVEDE